MTALPLPSPVDDIVVGPWKWGLKHYVCSEEDALLCFAPRPFVPHIGRFSGGHKVCRVDCVAEWATCSADMENFARLIEMQNAHLGPIGRPCLWYNPRTERWVFKSLLRSLNITTSFSKLEVLDLGTVDQSLPLKQVRTALVVSSALLASYKIVRRYWREQPKDAQIETLEPGFVMIGDTLCERTAAGDLHRVIEKIVTENALGGLTTSYRVEPNTFRGSHDESLLAVSPDPMVIELHSLPSFVGFLGVELSPGCVTVVGTGWREGKYFFTARHVLFKPGYVGHGQDLWLFRDPNGKRRRIPLLTRIVHVLEEGLDEYSNTGDDLCAIEVPDMTIFSDVGLSAAKRGSYSTSGRGVVTTYGISAGRIMACRGAIASDTLCEESRGVVGHTCGTFNTVSGSPGIQVNNGRSCIVFGHICWNGRSGSDARNFGVSCHAILALRAKLELDGIMDQLLQVLYGNRPRDESSEEGRRQAPWARLKKTKAEHRASTAVEKSKDTDVAAHHKAKLEAKFAGGETHAEIQLGRAVTLTPGMGAFRSKTGTNWADTEDEDESQKSTPAFVASRAALQLCRAKFRPRAGASGLLSDTFSSPLIEILLRAFPSVQFGVRELGNTLCLSKSQVQQELKFLEDCWKISLGRHGWFWSASPSDAGDSGEEAEFQTYEGFSASLLAYRLCSDFAPWPEVGLVGEGSPPVLPLVASFVEPPGLLAPQDGLSTAQALHGTSFADESISRSSPFFQFTRYVNQSVLLPPVPSTGWDCKFFDCSLPLTFGPSACPAHLDPVGNKMKFWKDSKNGPTPPDRFTPVRGTAYKLDEALARWMLYSDVEALSCLADVGSELLFAHPTSNLFKEYQNAGNLEFGRDETFAVDADDKVAARFVGSCSNITYNKPTREQHMDPVYLDVCDSLGFPMRDEKGDSKFVLPPTGVGAILDSLKGQLRNQRTDRSWKHFQDAPDFAETYMSGLSELPNCAPALADFDIAFDNIVNSFDGSKSSGYSSKFLPGTKGAWFEPGKRDILKYLVKFRMALRMACASTLGTLEPSAAVLAGVIDPRCVFIKSEAHGSNKIADKRWRLIWVPSIVDSVVQGVLHISQNKKSIRSYQEGCQNRVLAGLGHHDEGIARIGQVLDWLSDGNLANMNDEDASGWDLSVSRDAIMYDGCRRNLLMTGGTPSAVNVTREQMILESLCNGLHVIAVGKHLISVDIYGMTMSGIISTTEQNCNIREKQAQLCGAIRASALGDDLGYAGVVDPEKARLCGVIIKKTSPCGPRGPFSLTSHTFTKVGDRWHAVFENFPKLLAHIDLRRPASKPPSEDVLRGARFVCRASNDQLDFLDRLCRAMGWQFAHEGLVDPSLLDELF